MAKDTVLIRVRDKYYSLGGLARKSQEIDLDGVSEDELTVFSGNTDTKFVDAAGDSMTGPLLLVGDPVVSGQAATKHYVDELVQSIVVSGANQALYDLITDEYTAADLALSGALQMDFVNVSGDTMTGFLTLNADPTAALHAATKQYVDAKDAAVSGYVNSEISNLTTYIDDSDAVVVSLVTSGYQDGDASLSGYVDTQISALSGLVGGDYVSVSGDTMTGSLAITNGNLSIKTHNGYTGSDYVELTAAGQTTDATELTLHSLYIEEGYAYWFETVVIGKKVSPGMSRLRLEVSKGCVNRDISSSAFMVSIVDNPLTRSLDAGNYNVNTVVSGNNLLTIVNGDTSETVNWVATLKYQKIG